MILGNPVRMSCDDPRLSDVVRYEKTDFQSLRSTCKVTMYREQLLDFSDPPARNSLQDKVRRGSSIWISC